MCSAVSGGLAVSGVTVSVVCDRSSAGEQPPRFEAMHVEIETTSQDEGRF